MAPVRRQGPSPGPCEKAMASIWFGRTLAFLRAALMICPATSA